MALAQPFGMSLQPVRQLVSLTPPVPPPPAYCILPVYPLYAHVPTSRVFQTVVFLNFRQQFGEEGGQEYHTRSGARWLHPIQRQRGSIQEHLAFTRWSAPEPYFAVVGNKMRLHPRNFLKSRKFGLNQECLSLAAVLIFAASSETKRWSIHPDRKDFLIK